MQVEQAIYQRLASDPAIVAIVSNRIYPDEAEPGVDRPLIVYDVAASDEQRDLAGDVGFVRHTVNVYVLCDNKAELVAGCRAVNARLDKQDFDGVQRVYRIDYQTGETDAGGFVGVQTYNVWQTGEES